MSIAVLAGVMVECVVTTIYMLYRGIKHGIRREVIVVRYVTYTGRQAFRWGVVSILYGVAFAVGAFAAAVLLLRELSG